MAYTLQEHTKCKSFMHYLARASKQHKLAPSHAHTATAGMLRDELAAEGTGTSSSCTSTSNDALPLKPKERVPTYTSAIKKTRVRFEGLAEWRKGMAYNLISPEHLP